MNSNGVFGIKSVTMLFAAITIAFAGFQSEPGGRFDVLTKVKRKPSTLPGLRREFAAASDAGSAGAGAGVVATTTNSSVSNLVYPELSAIPSNFDINTAYQPVAPALPASDGLGAFRFLCSPGQVSADDPVVYPNQPGRAHLHQFFGNTGANAFSTYDSLRTTGESTCVNKGNRSAYWMPAMLDGVGHVVRPDFVTIYYKRFPDSSPTCQLASGGFHAMGNCIGLPNGLRMIFGYDMAASKPGTWAPAFACEGQTSQAGSDTTFQAAISHCPTAQNPDGTYNRIGITMDAPMCWNGKDLDSPDHRSHVGYPGFGSWGYLKCPSDKPFVIPGFAMKSWYTVDANLPTWHLSSDEMHPELPAGGTAHADWFGAWDNGVESMWLANCINKALDCSAGVLGNNKMMKPDINPFPWFATPRLVPVPG